MPSPTSAVLGQSLKSHEVFYVKRTQELYLGGEVKLVGEEEEIRIRLSSQRVDFLEIINAVK